MHHRPGDAVAGPAALRPPTTREPADDRAEHEPDLGRERHVGGDADEDPEGQAHRGSQCDRDANAHASSLCGGRATIGCVHTRRGDEITTARRALPWVPVDKAYRFDTDAGRRTLAELFEGRSQLLVYHFMLGPEYEAGCPSCSVIADGFQGFGPHMAARDVTMTAISRAPLPKLQAYKERMG